MSKNIAILGSTGSIGKSALKVISALGADYRVVALSAHSNFALLAEQARQYGPAVVAISEPSYADRLRQACAGLNVEILAGPESLEQIASLDVVDILITAVVGAAGLPAVLAGARQGKRLAIANKEPLAIAGEILTEVAKKSGATILPVDSEHSAIFQAMQAGSHDEVSKIILTASGGPFLNAGENEIKNATIQDALAHPTWNMGPKVTVDSATMMNKALEVIEAHWLFNMPVEKIEVLIHPESIIHSMVEFVDGSVIAQMSNPDMCLPIQYALTWPKRLKGISRPLRLEELGTLSFEKPNLKTFRALALGYEVARAGGSAPVVFNAANEAAVEEFLSGRITFGKIAELIEGCLCKHSAKKLGSLEQLLELDAWARDEVKKCLKRQKVH